ncbi:MAG TPA: glycoside hydrolase family 3 C-terminal domain-containing protein [Tessaracoccus flavescens]|uniref:Glycoside hydrolase family 3 C-terminal domain-containing protein n=1 Tax=Tessaracoccus flavescens TaxID=399497 RepID=A0A921EPB7_9ACTN|nr:glycoside hydrolase family 3 C-terminal domain-containing protein [Tessaracoccus flavescens]
METASQKSSPISTQQLQNLVDAALAKLDDDTCIALLHQVSPALPQLGLDEFHTGAEALHGVAWNGTATVFPQPVGMAATWDHELLRELGDAVATELRAMHAADPVKVSLNCWAPVVNPLRHPLWGRNEEGYSEDPHVTADCAIAYAGGLRGSDPVFWKTVPTLKHLLAYNNEMDRCTSNSSLPPRVLHEFDLPAFVAPIRAGVIGGVMAAYNLVNGRPAHTSKELFDAVRQEDGQLLAVSDAYAPTNLTGMERAFATDAEAHAAAILAGLDSFTDRDADSSHTINAIKEALAQGLLDITDVRKAARRVLLARARSGELTPELDPYGSIAAHQIDLPEHRQLARRASAAQVTILANDGILPLKDHPRLAVVGPHATVVKHDWYSGTPPYMVTLADAAAEDFHIERHDGADRVQLRSTTTGLPVSRADDGALVADVDTDSIFAVTDWGSGQVTIADDSTGLLWRGQDDSMIKVDAMRPEGWVTHQSFLRHVHADGTWSLQHRGSRRWLRVETWGGLVTATVDDLAQAERFVVEVHTDGPAEVSRLAAEADIVIVAVGNDPHINGRETADRPELALPEAQARLVTAALDTNPRTVLVVISSYPYALGTLAERAAAVVWSSHAGQELGHGLMDTLTARHQPTGRLAQTWWASEEDAGDLFNYDIIDARMTWWYNPATPLYPLGHGLTYSTVEYRDLELPDGLHGSASVTVHNTGAAAADELVQLYAVSDDNRIGRRLLGHQRVQLAAGEQAVVSVAIRPQRLKVWRPDLNAFDWPEAAWEVVAAPSAALDGPRHTAQTTPDNPLVPADLPLTVWHAPLWDGVVGVPTGVLEGTAYRARYGHGRCEWPSVTPLPSRLRLTVRDDKGVGGELRLVSGDTAVAAQADPAQLGKWHDIEVEWPAVGATSLTLTLSGTLAVSTIGHAR